MHSEVWIEGLASQTVSITSQTNRCGESQEVDGEGKVIGAATASADRMFFTNLRGSQTVDPEGGVVDGIAGSIQIDVGGSAGMPLMPSPDMITLEPSPLTVQKAMFSSVGRFRSFLPLKCISR